MEYVIKMVNSSKDQQTWTVEDQAQPTKIAGEQSTTSLTPISTPKDILDISLVIEQANCDPYKATISYGATSNPLWTLSNEKLAKLESNIDPAGLTTVTITANLNS